MNQLIATKSFIFRKAEYRLEDATGNIIILKVDYAQGEFKIKKINISGRSIRGLLNEAEMVAFDLLKRKSNNNRVEALNGKK